MRKAAAVESFTSNFVMALGAARLLRLCFWVKMYVDGDTFIFLMLADILHTVILADFAYIYL